MDLMDEDEMRVLQLFLFDELSDEEDDYDVDVAEEDGAQLIRVDVEGWQRLGDPTFLQHFRMDRATFDLLLLAVGRHLDGNGRILRHRSPLSLSLMMVLWILATPDTFRSVAVKFKVTGSTVHFHYKYIVEALREMSPNYISWPSAYEREIIAEDLEERYGYPGVVGCIDGCQIKISAPIEQPARYVNYHHDHAIIVQAVCDNNKVFRDVFVGQPGSVGDARTFDRSSLWDRILTDEELVGDKHLLGDGAYTCTTKLMCPYRDYGNLTPRQRSHNYYLSRCRSIIERAFALLKGKWRRLKYFPNYCLEYALDSIMACIVLHNFIILEGQSYQVVDRPPLVHFGQVERNQLMRRAKNAGSVKRNFIAGTLYG